MRRLDVKLGFAQWASPKTGKRMSLRKIAAALTEAGHLNERGQPFNPKSIVAMVAQKT